MSEWLMLILVVTALGCAVQAIRTPRLLHAALWLAGASALVSLILYGLGAHEVAAIELSVGAGLVTVLFVFAINIAGDEGPGGRIVVPRWLAWGAVILAGALLLITVLPLPGNAPSPEQTATFAAALWEDRGLDVLVQIALIFAGGLAVLGLIGDSRVAEHTAAHPGKAIEAIAARTNGRSSATAPQAVKTETDVEPIAPETQVSG
jgi:NADH:ubiquinone oxidoreductase subunit 6 (subunit J)